LVQDKQATVDLLQIEQKHSTKLRAIKLTALYVKPGQTSMEEIFANKPKESSPFYTFMDHLAERVDMNGWPHYRGEMGDQGDDNAISSYRHSLLSCRFAPILSEI